MEEWKIVKKKKKKVQGQLDINRHKNKYGPPKHQVQILNLMDHRPKVKGWNNIILEIKFGANPHDLGLGNGYKIWEQKHTHKRQRKKHKDKLYIIQILNFYASKDST